MARTVCYPHTARSDARAVRLWTETVETVVLEIIQWPAAAANAAMGALRLVLASRRFTARVKGGRVLYNFRILRDSTLGVQVIAIGNLTWAHGQNAGGRKICARVERAGARGGDFLTRLPFEAATVEQAFHRQTSSAAMIVLRRVVSDGKSLLLDSERPATSHTCWRRI